MARHFNLRATTRPDRAPAGREVIFIDEADGHMKSVNPAGVITDLETGGAGGVSVTDADPGAVGAGGLWLQTNAGEGGAEYIRLWVRNVTDDGWISTGPISVLNGNVQVLIGPTATIEVGLDEDASTYSVSGAAQVQLNAASTRLGTSVRIELRQGIADPSAGGGVAAPVGSLYVRQTAVDGIGSLWQKIGDADTEWALIFGSLSLASYLAAGAISLTSANAEDLSLSAGGGADVNITGIAINLTGAVNIDGEPVGTRAAFVANGSTVDQLRDALIASGLMAAS